MRLFIAICFDEITKDKIYQFQTKLKGSVGPANWVPKDNLHLTIKFLGNGISKDKVNPILEKLCPIWEKFCPFPIELRKLGVFPSIVNPRVLWLGVESSPLLLSLKDATEKAMHLLGWEMEKNPYIPHIALARLKTTTDLVNLQKSMEEYQSEKISHYNVRNIHLLESCSTPQGVYYRDLERLT